MRLQFLEAGEIVTTHGVRGEVKVLPWADGPDFLMHFKRVKVGGKEYEVESCRIQKSCNLVKLRGVDSMEAAQSLRGKVLEIFRQDADPSAVFVSELIGMKVYACGTGIGTITDVLDYPGNKVYVVSGEKEYMVPAVQQFILSTDIDKNEMQIQLLEGMETDEN